MQHSGTGMQTTNESVRSSGLIERRRWRQEAPGLVDPYMVVQASGGDALFEAARGRGHSRGLAVGNQSTAAGRANGRPGDELGRWAEWSECLASDGTAGRRKGIQED
ncbi:unnamed protein product [Protopolystoma xenopodis]|uniref:Uncharacterized protein n=1 Tax=Protopolystoma xenopodis TaxID=117903 RepID=A0A448XQK6_9PLAT|nr:unnamed protein product [Protopolystoma xenopodis]